MHIQQHTSLDFRSNAGPDGIAASMHEVVRALQSKGVECYVSPTVGYQCYLQDVSLTGKVVAIEKTTVGKPVGFGLIEHPGELITVQSDDTARQFVVKAENAVLEGQVVTIHGVVCAAAGDSEFRLANLKEMLSDRKPATAISITINNELKYFDSECFDSMKGTRKNWLLLPPITAPSPLPFGNKGDLLTSFI